MPPQRLSAGAQIVKLFFGDHSAKDNGKTKTPGVLPGVFSLGQRLFTNRAGVPYLLLVAKIKFLGVHLATVHHLHQVVSGHCIRNRNLFQSA